MSEPDGSPEAERQVSRMVEAAGVEPASESTSPQDSTCVSAFNVSIPAQDSGENRRDPDPVYLTVRRRVAN